MFKNSEMLILWLANFFCALTIVCARIGYSLYALDVSVPEDPVKAKHWERRRKWLAISEISVLPAFATIGIVAKIYWNLPDIASVLISMVLGALGFGFLLDGLQFLIKRRLGIET